MRWGRLVSYGLTGAVALYSLALMLPRPFPPHQYGLEKPCKDLDGCTKLIESGTLSGIDLAEAYYARSGLKDRDIPGTMADLSRAIELNPKLDLAYYARGLGYSLAKQPDLAIADFTKAIESAVIVPRAAYRGRRDAYAAVGKYDLAIADATTLIETSAYQMLVQPNWGHYLSQWLLDRLDGAGGPGRQQRVYELEDRAELYLKVGQTEKAAADVGRAAELAIYSNWRARDLFRHAQLLEQLGRRDEAIADYRQAEQLDPGSPRYREALSRLGAEP
jgi:tetratricopeptide (TPR) repeat protein